MYYNLENKVFLHLLWALLLLILLFIWWIRWRKKARAILGDTLLIIPLISRFSKHNHHIKFIVCLAGLLLLIVGLSNPQKEESTYQATGRSANVILVVDVSLSMLAEDIAPNRLERVKKTLTEVIRHLKYEQVGLVAFAGQALPMIPLTNDYSLIGTTLASLTPEQISLQGSSINEALLISFQLLLGSQPENSIVFLLSDGEILNENITDVMGSISHFKGKICTIGFGKESGGNIPLHTDDMEKTFKKDARGNIVLTRLNESNLRQLAGQGRGAYFYSNHIEQTAVFIIDQIKQINSSSINNPKVLHKESYFQSFLALALGVLLLELFIPSCKI